MAPDSHASERHSRSPVPVRMSSMNHLNQVAAGSATAGTASTGTGATSSYSRPTTSPHSPRPQYSFDELAAIPPTPPPPPSHPLPAPPSQKPRRPSNASVTGRPRGMSNSSSAPRPRAASNASRYGGPTSPVGPPAARSAGTARRGTVGSHPHHQHHPAAAERSESPPRQPPQTPEQLMRLIRERTRDSYIRIRERPSVPELSRSDLSVPPPRSASTRSAPLGHTPNDSIGSGHAKYSAHAMKGGFHSVAAGPVVPSLPTGFRAEPGCFPMKKGGVGGLGGNRIEGLGIMGDVDGPRPKWEVSDSGGPGAGRAYDMVDNRHRSRSQSHNREGGRGAKVVEGVRQKLKHMFRGFHISVSVSFNEKAPEYARYQRTEMTLRIKNNLHGNCVFEVFPSSLSPTIDHGEGGDMDEVLQPVEHLKTLFPHDKNLQRSLQEWNRIFQTPPPHWVVNFVPRAYLRRGYYLAEEVLEYLTTHPDGCQYTVEYEPIGHQPCVVGSVANTVGRNRSMKRGPAGTGGGGDMWWEGKEKEKF